MNKKLIITIIAAIAIVAAIAVVAVVLGGGSSTHTHAYSDWEATKSPTCTQDGSKERSCACGDIQTISVPASGHSFENWKTEVAATCTIAGKDSRKCASCGETETKTIAAKHSYSGWITDVEATCAATGKKHSSCSVCGDTKEEIISKTTIHNYDDGVVTVEASCSTEGSKTVTCTVCGTTAKRSISALGHNVDNTGKCKRCGLVTLNMTQQQITDSKAVETMSYSVYEYSYEISINITLKDDNNYTKQVPVYVDVKILDDDGAVLYSKTLVKKASQDKVVIDYDEIKNAVTNTGTLYYKVYNDYVSFDENSKELTQIPWTVSISLPSVPTIISYIGYSGKYTSCKITGITYKVSGDDVYFYFTGEKTYDKEGSGYSRSCQIGWKLYDSDGYVIEDGTCYTTSLKVGEKFKDADCYAYGVIEQGKTYRLVISDVN